MANLALLEEIEPSKGLSNKPTPKKYKKGKNRFLKKSVIPHLILAVVGLLFLTPFVWLVLTSLKTSDEIFAIPLQWLPEKFIWSSYTDAMQSIPFFNYLWNTVLICMLSVAGQLFSSPLVAYAFSRLQFKGRNFLFFLMMATMILPYQVTMIPLYVLFNKLGMVDSILPLVLPSFFGSAFNIFLLRQFFLGIPNEYTESAKLDGASEFKIYWKIILPLSKPALFTIALLTFLAAWSDYLGPLIYLNDPANWTLSIGLKAFIGANQIDWGMLMASSVMFTLPVIVLYFFVQKQFIEGVTLTGFK
ncbi:sugar ABC transporter permease [Oceanobacillus arenosus]|uniref:Sugar ABC transporter permease n=1 Tax=Oceanobacillus arenosus TaxID=1229153 RepID=A0A3D8Q1U6_9BACI|nr:carbohydrate ABC transporter permease [Oceanobacillus arenosus]RDW22193.1 sugar ABC transporter permease [Oceanobacillus arenosus]